MKTTRRMKRMTRNKVRIGRMNLTSLMDVFTILVFFLLVNSGTPEVLETPKEVVLPESKVEAKPRETVVIFIGTEQVVVQGEPVATVEAIADMSEGQIGPIIDRLAVLEDRIIGSATQYVAGSQEVTILADRSVPFDVIRKVMSTCTSQGYSRISLAVIQKASPNLAAGDQFAQS
ncbi:MAG: biopolymer transporter ExbD [Gammaproteobacteria bacterium]|jgi:biopolymer transport protein ExbD